MSDQQKITAFNQSSKQNVREGDDGKPDEFGWGSFGMPPEDWPISRVEDLFEIRKNSVDPEELDENELIRLYSMPAFDDGAEPELTRAGDIGSKKFYVPNHTLLFSKLNILKKRFWLVNHDHEEPTICSTEYWPLIPNKNLNLEFYYQYFNSDSFIDRPRLSTSSTTNSHQRIKSNLFDKVRLPVPPIEEQQKIATVLHNVDQAIQKTEEIIEQLERVKEGLYQTLFSEGYQKHSRFKSSKYSEIPESWHVLKLSEITSQIQAGGTPDTDKPEYYGGDIPWVKTGELSQYRVTETEQKITKKGFKESTARLFSPGTILIAMYGATTGEVSLLDIEATTNQACCGVITTNKMEPEFLFHQLNHLSNYLESLSAGSGQQNISKGIIKKFDVLVPTVEEQNSIVSVLNSVDESIAENKSTKKQYQRLKQGLMQDLLSGTVRTTDTNIEVPGEIAQHG